MAVFPVNKNHYGRFDLGQNPGRRSSVRRSTEPNCWHAELPRTLATAKGLLAFTRSQKLNTRPDALVLK